MRVLICGGRNVGRAPRSRDFRAVPRELEAASRAREFVTDTLTRLHAQYNFTTVICGVEGGAERLGKNWAEVQGLPTSLFPLAYGERISKRNLRMLIDGRPELVVALGGGENTDQLLAEASQRGIPMLKFDIPE